MSHAEPTYELRRVCGPGDAEESSPLPIRWPSDQVALLLMFGGLPLLLLAMTALFRLTDADLEICRWFYAAAQDRWHGSDWLACSLLYSYGPLPALVVGVGGLLVWLASRWHQALRPWAGTGIFLALMLALGPGLLVNGIFKPYWYRPRPKQVSDFGGNLDFVYVWGVASDTHSRSFPSGHASMGFYLMAPAFLLYRRRPGWALAFLGVGLAAGSAIGIARLAQGGHFASDVLWAGGMVYATGLLLSGLFQLSDHLRSRWRRHARSRRFAIADVRGAMVNDVDSEDDPPILRGHSVRRFPAPRQKAA